jgi:hypothetical protein
MFASPAFPGAGEPLSEPRDTELFRDMHAEADDIYWANIARLIARRAYTPPAHRFPGRGYRA